MANLILIDGYIPILDNYLPKGYKGKRYFKYSELANQGEDGPFVKIDMNIILFTTMLTLFRIWYKRPMVPASWFRTVKHNSLTKGSDSNSSHLRGLAFDFHFPEAEWKEFSESRKIIFIDHVVKKWVKLSDQFNTPVHIILYEWGFHLSAFDKPKDSFKNVSLSYQKYNYVFENIEEA